MNINDKKRLLADKLNVSIGIVNQMIQKQINDLSGLIDDDGAITILQKQFAEKENEPIIKPSKSTNFFDMLGSGSYEKVVNKDLPKVFILKIEDILIWKGTTQYSKEEETSEYIRGVMYYKEQNEKIEKSLTWFPPQSVKTHFKRLQIKIGSIVRITNMGFVEATKDFPQHWNMYVELLQQ